MKEDRNLIDGCSKERLYPGELLEFKNLTETRGGLLGPVWLTTPIRFRWYHFVPLACLLILGASVPDFFLTLVVILVSLAVALVCFVLFVQLPVGYLVRYLRGVRQAEKARRRTQRPSSSSGI